GIDHQRPGHVLVAVTAEDVAGEGESPGLLGGHLHPRGPARRNVGPDAELRQLEAVLPVERGELQHHVLALPDVDLGGRVLELLRRHLDDPGRRALRRKDAPGQLQQHSERHADHHAPHTRPPFTSYSSRVTAFPLSLRSISRYPSPRAGCCGSHATGAFFGTLIGAGRGNISDFAEWWLMWPVVRWFSWWMCP